jgi:transcriptional regulator with XRE-family HTH domain
VKGLRWWRRARGLTQAELAEASGVERSHLAKIERDEVDEPRPDTWRRLAEALGVTFMDLNFGEAAIEIFGPPEDLVRGSEQHHRNITGTSPISHDYAHQAPTTHPLETSERTNR